MWSAGTVQVYDEVQKLKNDNQDEFLSQDMLLTADSCTHKLVLPAGELVSCVEVKKKKKKELLPDQEVEGNGPGLLWKVVIENSSIHLQPFTLTTAEIKARGHVVQSLTNMDSCEYSGCKTTRLSLIFHILVIVKRESEELLLFEVEVGRNQVEELVRQQFWLQKKVYFITQLRACTANLHSR